MRYPFLIAALVATTSAGAARAEKNLTYDVAKIIAEAAYEACAAQGFHVSVHVVGPSGETRFAIRGDGAGSNTFENSRRKAYTVRMRPDLQIEGGLPIKAGAEIIGGIGVNGSQRANQSCAQAGINKTSDLLK
jgi:uncharacterized protein GlcG (DUF336 family)